MLKFKKIADQVEIYDNHTCVYQDTFENFQQDFQNSGINFNYEFMLCDPEALHLILNNGDATESLVPGQEWTTLFSAIQSIQASKNARDTNINRLNEMAAALDKVDFMAGQIRAKIITVAPGQESTYLMKAFQAHDFKNAGYAGTCPPLIVAEVNAAGLSPQETTDIILAKEAEWLYVAGIIEEIRRFSKIKIQSATSMDDLRIQLAAAQDRFSNLADQIKG